MTNVREASQTAGGQGVKNLLESDVEVVCRSGSVYVPLLLDPSVAREVEGSRPNDLVIEVGGELFVRTMSLRSLVESCESLDPAAFHELRRSSLAEEAALPPASPAVSERLKTILLAVMPRFVRRARSLERKRLDRDELLDLIGERGKSPSGSAGAERPLQDPVVLRRALADLEARSPALSPPPEGRMPARALGQWLSTAFVARIVELERRHVTQLLEAMPEPAGAAGAREAILLDVARRGALEIDGFGFVRTGPGDDWLIYKRTGEFVLKDYYGRLYLFPDCRVAVSTAGALRPFVVEPYKHPFLEAHDSGQEICLKRPGRWNVFSGEAVVEALEEGLSALLHGYSSRRRNGYHSLEGILRSVSTPGPGISEPMAPEDYPVVRRRHILDVDFTDYRIPSDHPKVASGRVQITNDLLP